MVVVSEAPWEKYAGNLSKNPAAPKGLQQAADRNQTYQADNRGALPPWLQGGYTQASQDWYSGANNQGTNSGYDITGGFIDKMQSGYDQAAENGGLKKYFDYAGSKSTGIATYDYEADAEDGQTRKYRFGDIYEDGEYQGNLYDEKSGFDKQTADLMMADLLFDGKTKAEIFSSSDREERLSREVQAAREKNNTDIPKMLSAAAFQSDVDERQAEFQEGARDEIGATLAGGAGGAVVGGGIGSVLPGVGTAIGAGVGFGIGAVGGYLNRDELSEQAARASLITGMANRDFGTLEAITTGIQQWSGVAGKMLTPLSNTVHGLYDVSAGDGGDGDSEFYRVDDEGKRQAPVWLRGVDLAANVGDALLQFASPIGAQAYMVQMGGTIAGETGMLALTGNSFDDRRGGFDNIFTDDNGNFDMTSAAAGIGKIGIDVVQLGMARGLVNKAQASRQFAGLDDAAQPGLLARASDKLPLWMGGSRGLAEGERRVAIGGFSYTMKADGTIAEGGRRATLSMLAPSEQIAALSTGAIARRAAARNGGAATADDFYRAAVSLSAGERKITSAFVNAFGEGNEEALQAILEPMSHNATPDAGQILESFYTGAAMGLGMSLGASTRAAGQDQKLYAMAQANHAFMTGGAELDKSTWAAMTDIEKRAAAAMAPVTQAVAEETYRKIEDDQRAGMVASVSDVAKLDDAARKAQDSVLAKLTKRTDGAFVITQLEDAGSVDADGNLRPGSMPNDAVGSSANQLAANLQMHAEGLAVQRKWLQDRVTQLNEDAAKTTDEQQLADIQAEAQRVTRELTTAEMTIEMATAVNATVAEMAAEIDAHLERGDEIAARTTVEELNDFIRNAFHRRIPRLPGVESMTDEQKTAMARAVSTVFVREPKDQSGSFLVLVPQASWALTRERTDHLLEISHAVLPAIRGDYDGDKIRQQAQLVLDDAEYTAARSGDFFLGAGSTVNLASQKYEKWIMADIARAAASGNETLSGLATHFLVQVGRSVKARFGTVMPVTEIDKAVALFNDAAVAGDPDARQVLIDELAKRGSGGIVELGRSRLSNEWLWLDQMVQANLQEFQRAYAAYRPDLGTPNTELVLTNRQTKDVRRRLAAKAATLGQTLGIWTEGPGMFRSFQKLHYSSYMSQVLSTKDVDQSQLTELVRLYEMLGARATRSELDNVQSKDDITGSVLVQLNRMAEQAGAELGIDANYAPVILANLRVQDYQRDSDNRPVALAGKITLAQMLLRRAVERDQIEKQAIIERSPELQAKHSRLLAMTRPGGTVNAERAFIEVFGAVPLYQLLGESAAIFGPNLTTEQFERKYQSMHESERSQVEKALMDHPEYLGRKQTRSAPFDLADLEVEDGVTAYRSVLDSLLNVGRFELSTDKQGRTVGAKADRSRQVSSDFHAVHGQMQAALRQFRAISPRQGESDALAIQRMLEQNPDFARRMLDLIPDAAAAATFELRGDEVYIANWFYETFAQPTAKQAEMHYWRNLLLAQWNAARSSFVEADEAGTHARSYSKLTRRTLRILYRLQANADNGKSLLDFLNKMESATDLEEFLSWVNRNEGVRGRQAPILAWVDDTADFDADKAGGGWSKNLSGSELREAIANLRADSQRLVQILGDEKRAIDVDTQVLASIERAGTSRETDADRRLAEKLDKVIELAGERMQGIGPAAMVQQSIGSVMGFYPQAHTKGQNPPFYGPAGAFDAQRDALDYTTNFERVMAAFTSVNLNALGGNLGMAAKDDIRSMDDYGNVIEWSKPTRAEIVELFKNPDTRPIARAILFPTVMERTLDGRITPQFLVGKSLAELLDGASMNSLFRKNEAGFLMHQAAMTYDSMLEAQARRHGAPSGAVQRAVNDIIIARTSASRQVLTAEQAERMANEAYREVAELMQLVGSIVASPNDRSMLDQLRKDIRQGARAVRVSQTLGIEPGTARDQLEFLTQELIKTRETESFARREALREQRKGTKNKDEKARLQRMLDAEQQSIDKLKEQVDMLMSDDYFGMIVEKFAIPEDAVAALAVKQQILDYIKSTGTILQQRVPAVIDTFQKLSNQLIDPNNYGSVELTDKEWTELSHAVIALYMDDTVSMTAAGVAVPVYPNPDQASQRRYYDPSWSYLVDELLDANSPLAQAAADLHLEAGRHGEVATREQVLDVVGRGILDERRLGDWTTDIPRASIEASQRLDASAAAPAIAMAGNSPKRQAVISAATRRTYENPGDALLSTVTLNYWSLNSADLYNEVDVQLAGSTEPSRMPLAQLNNRFAKTAVLSYVDAEGNPATLDLMSIPSVAEVGFAWTNDETVGSSGYKVITIDRLSRAVDTVLAQLPEQTVPAQIQVEFFHPDTQPAGQQWMNNIYFEGTSFPLRADNFESLNSTLWFASGSISPDAQAAALDANKLGKPALTVLDPVPAAKRDETETDWKTDFASMLRAKTAAIMQTDLGNGQLEPNFYNAVYKNIKLRHFVKGTYGGKPVLWTAEQVIASQRNGEVLAEVMPDAALWIPSDDVLRSMLGEPGDQGVSRYFENGLETDLARVPTFRGVTPAMLARFTEGPGTVELADTRIANRARQTQLTVRTSLDQATLDAYDLRIQRFNAMRTPIHDDRAQIPRNEGGFNPLVNMDAAVKAGEKMLRAENISFDWSRMGIPWIGPRSAYETAASEVLLRSLETAITGNGAITGWIYQESGESSPTRGRLTQADLHGEPSRPGLAVAPGDLVVVELDTFRGNRERMHQVLRYFVDRGASIVLGGTDGATDERVESAVLLESTGYERIAGSVHIYQPAALGGAYQNRRARESTLVETRGISTRNQLAVFLTKGEYITENAAWVVEKNTGEREALRSIGVSLNLVPTDFLSDVNVPVGGQVDAVRAKLEYMLGTDEGRQHLRDLSGPEKQTGGFTLDEAIDRLLLRWQGAEGVLPVAGQEFGTGDIVPLVDSNGNILLYRHGHEAPSRDELVEQWRVPLADESTPYGVGIFRASTEPAATTHTGEVVRFIHRPGLGLAVEMNIPLSIFGDKKQLEWNGMKYILTPMPDSFPLPEHGFFANGWSLDIISDSDSAFSKESFGGLVNNHRNAFAYFGIDFMPDLQKFFGVEPAKIRSLLESVAKRAPRISIAQANDIIGAQFVEPAFADLLLAFNAAQRGSLGLDSEWVQKLNESSPEAVITASMLTYLMTPGARVEDVLQSGGFNSREALSGELQSRLMPQLFTQVFDLAPLGSDLRAEMNRRFNQQLYNPNSDGTGYVLHPDWTFEIITKDGDKMMRQPGLLQFAEAHSSGDNPFKNGMSFDPSDKSPVSQHSAAITYLATGAETAFSGSLKRAQEFLTDKSIIRFNDAKDGGVWRMLTDVPREDKTFEQWRMPTPLEQERRALAREAVVGFRQAISKENWSATEVSDYQDVRLSITRKLGLLDSQVEVVDFWVRQILGMPLGEAELPNGQVEMMGQIGAKAALEAANDVLWNVTQGYLPTVAAEQPQLHLVDLQLIYLANQGRANGWKPRVDLTAKSDFARSWDDWVQIALGSAMLDDSSIYDPMYLLATDGFMHTYQNATSSLIHLPVSRDMLVSQNLLDPDTNRLFVSISGDVNTLAVEPLILESTQASLAQILGGQRIGGRFKDKSAPASEIAKRRAARRKWRRENGVPFPADVTMRNFRKNGEKFTDYSTSTNALFRMLINLRVGTALINPALWISAGPEMLFRSTIDTASSLLTGDATRGPLAKAAAKLGASRYSTDQLAQADSLYRVLGERHDFKAMIYRELMYLRPHQPGIGKLEKALEGYAKFGSFLQDPTWGMRGTSLARRYMEAAMQHIMATPTETVVSFEALVAGMKNDPNWLQKNVPDAHRAGANAVAQIRSLKQTPASIALRGIYEPMASSDNGIVNGIGNVLLKMPLMFSGYAANVATTLLGMQGFSDALAMYLDGRNNRFTRALAHTSAKLGGQEFDPTSYKGPDMSSVLEGIDLSRSFIRGQVTLTGLFTMGMLAGGLGLSGEDEEMRRRRRAAELQGAAVLYDPRKLENDFRNADSLFLDGVMGLAGYFGIGDGEEARSMSDLPWILRQFVSPVVGIERFLETGDPRQVTWGFQDALASFPLINSLMWDDAVATYDELMKEAEKEGKVDSLDSVSSSTKFMISAVATYERMLVENSFVNQIYIAQDRYDRDPYKLPAITDTGEARQMYTPNGSEEYGQRTALEDYRDPVTGEIKQGYMGRDFAGTQYRVLSENRATLAVLGSLFTGKGLSGDTIRNNMPVKMREFDKPEITPEQFRAIVGKIMWDEQGGALNLTPQEIRGSLIERNKAIGVFQSAAELDKEAALISKRSGVSELSVIDQDGVEVLTQAGAAAILQGLVKGTVKLGDESLRGIHMTFEQREQIQADWMADLVQEGVDLGLSRSQAEYRMYRIWNGPSTNPEVLGIKDILWSNEISYSKKLEYKQLNTTYVTGPDGLPWATGFTRGGLKAALGIIPNYQWGSERQGGIGNMGGALGQDDRLNIQDFSAGINTGLRALEPSNETAYIPGLEDIEKSIEKAIEAIKGLDFKTTDPYSTAKSGGGYGSYRRFGGGGGYRRGGGGGGGGSTFYSRLYALPNNQAPFGNTVPFINTSNPIIRRANIRRERVTSERGRLNQWQ